MRPYNQLFSLSLMQPYLDLSHGSCAAMVAHLSKAYANGGCL